MHIFAVNFISMRIKEIIKVHRLTSKEVAQRMGISPEGLSYHINGNPSVEVLERIATAIGCEVGDFFESTSNGDFKCPHCGTALKVSVELTKRKE